MNQNFWYGFAVVGPWLMNIGLYFYTLSLESQFVFSESIEWQHRDEVMLVDDLDDDTTLVGALVKEHDEDNYAFDRVCGWSGMAIMVFVLVVWMVVMVMKQ